ncbi:Metallo-hydrolase/oxidoreductase [Corynespora cassiicola Philippines]|uniref:Metallo-hydrolase/oxidoreductase n=1 Tax=Corynespora cassiicola Philippines TaxID=1448308 RepID=A0A2T2NTC3_CORCC|nr:Metallo-hydrolase/oxidoreductase [Corynespora cassiicola Philippines]
MPDIHTSAIPQEGNTCVLCIVDTTCKLTVPSNTLVEPAIPGHEFMNFPTFAFLISNKASGQQVLYDLGCKKEFWDLPGPTAEAINTRVPGIRVDKNLVEVLEEGGVEVSKLDAAIISHHHYDHIGDPSTFPASMELVVGPGFSKKFLPGYPTVEESPVFEDDLEGRNIRELSFSDDLVVAGYRAIDYFEDGSLYILDTPGHAIGHISAMVRTTQDTFAFLGGDVCHFGGSFRPTPFIPMPEWLEPCSVGHRGIKDEPYNHSIFTRCHPNQEHARIAPYYTPCCRPDSWYVDPARARKSIRQLQALDAMDKVLVLIAHDPAVIDVVTFFPEGSANDWYKLGWKDALHWRFLNELPTDVQETRYLVDGTYMDGKRTKTLEGRRVD